MPIKTKADWFVESVTPRRDYTLTLAFANGQTRVYDARELLDDAAFAPLRDVAFFLKARRAGHSVVWSEDIDIAPEYLFEKSVPLRCD